MTLHSGEGMPVNQPTHAHGQGYTDLNFMIPELAQAITYTKGPYYADVGDFGAVGSVHGAEGLITAIWEAIPCHRDRVSRRRRFTTFRGWPRPVRTHRLRRTR